MRNSPNQIMKVSALRSQSIPEPPAIRVKRPAGRRQRFLIMDALESYMALIRRQFFNMVVTLLDL